jgi:hypothetical protein
VNGVKKIDEVESVRYYREMLNEKRSRFPTHFFDEHREQAPFVTRYLIEHVLGWGEEDIKTKFDGDVLNRYGLSGFYLHVYKKHLYDVIQDAYPYRFFPWEIKRVPQHYWKNKENCIRATEWLLEEKLGWTEEEIKKGYNMMVFKDHGFMGMIKGGWQGSIFDLLDAVYPGKFKIWELENYKIRTWTPELGIQVIRHFIEEKMKWNEEDIKKKWRVRELKKQGIYRVLQACFDRNMFAAIDAAYPGKFTRDDFPAEPEQLKKE